MPRPTRIEYEGERPVSFPSRTVRKTDPLTVSFSEVTWQMPE